MSDGPAHTPIIARRPASPEAGWFDRFYVNAHDSSSVPYFLIGAGAYPKQRVVDGYVVAVTSDEQRNLRVSRQFEGNDVPSEAGPLSWSMSPDGAVLRVRLEPNPTGVAFDLEWVARTDAWSCEPIRLDDRRGNVSEFDHAFQSGHHGGWASIDGTQLDVRGWLGQRDRSRGTRMVTARQAVHLWVQAQFDDRVVAFILDLDRQGRLVLLDGAVLHEGGGSDPIVAAGHDLVFDDELECRSGRLRLRTAGGADLELDVDLSVAGGGYLSGAGYGGWHGVARGTEHLEHEAWALDDPAASPRRLDMPMTDRLAAFELRDGSLTRRGAGIFEFAHTRSPQYVYEPTGDRVEPRIDPGS